MIVKQLSENGKLTKEATLLCQQLKINADDIGEPDDANALNKLLENILRGKEKVVGYHRVYNTSSPRNKSFDPIRKQSEDQMQNESNNNNRWHSY